VPREGRSLEPPVESGSSAPLLLMEQVGSDVADALLFFSSLFGPVPYSPLNVSQSPGRIAQGYPGLLYLSTFSFLPENAQIRLGLSETARQHYSYVTPAHETAHQWWGNWVWMFDYRSQWLAEALASYSALLYLEQQSPSQGSLGKWLEEYRTKLLQEDESGQPIEATGALTLGVRLNSSQNPDGYAAVIYSKWPWVIHMLRELLRDPATGSDDLFLNVLRKLAAEGGGQPLTTEEFQRRFEAVLPVRADLEGDGSLDWFFQQWVHDTGMPRYHLQWKGHDGEEGTWQVEGTIEQSGVSDLFTMPVPVYARLGEGLERLGAVTVTGEVATFRFAVSAKPDDLVLDPYLTVLSVVE
jgi:aminopeptidase N